MAHNLLLTGVSGYLGGTLLARLRGAALLPFANIHALVRTPEQAELVRQYDVQPLILDVKDEASVTSAILTNEITIIYFLIDAGKADTQVVMIRALAQVHQRTGREVHFLHTTGAKLFSSHVGHPIDKPLLDTDPELYDLQKTLRGPFKIMNQALETNNTVIETSEAHGVRSYIFVPCIVYGEGEGFGNRISIQTVAIVQAAKALRQVYRTQRGDPVWPVCHIVDNTTLYLDILRKILEGNDLGHGKSGYFLASSGHVAWNDLYSAMAKGLAARDVTDGDSVKDADDAILEEMGQALGCPKELVSVQLSGSCALEADHGRRIGWNPQYQAKHILEMADAEVEIILRSKN